MMLTPIQDKAIEQAVAGLVRSSALGEATLVSLPFSYPSGSAVSVRVTPTHGQRYLVSDFAFGYREAEAIGAERSFGANAGKMAESYGLVYGDGHQLSMTVNANQIGGAIGVVGAASLEIANKVFANAPEWQAEEMAANLLERLRTIFGPSNVSGETTVAGASNVDWHFAAKVTRDGHSVLFDVATPHHASVFSAASKFNDIARLDEEISAVTVVQDKQAMGKWLPLLSQVSIVVEESASNSTLKHAVDISV